MKAALAAALALWGLAGCAHAPAVAQLLPGQVDAALTLERAGGKPRGRLQGKVVLVDFFATWCFPCIAELPLLERLQRENEAFGFTIVAVGMDLEGRKVLRPFVESYALPYPVMIASDELRAGTSVFGPVRALPTYFLFDRQGQLLVAYQGVADPAKLLKLVHDAARN